MEWLAVIGEEYGEACKGSLQLRFGGATAGSYREELLHTAACCIAAVESLDRQARYPDHAGIEREAARLEVQQIGDRLIAVIDGLEQQELPPQ